MSDAPLLPCPFCGSPDVDPEGWLSSAEDPATGDALTRGPECNGCGATARSVGEWNRRPGNKPGGPVLDIREHMAMAAEVRRLRAIVRVNGLRAGMSHAEVDAVLAPDNGKPPGTAPAA